MSSSTADTGEPAARSVMATTAWRGGWRPVTTAFLQRADGRVLVVRRSDKVRTYPGLWGGISGGVEPDDKSLIDRAVAEVEEEVGIPPSRLRLKCIGRPQPVRDGGRRFLVHPFLLAVEGSGDSRGAGTGAKGAAPASASAARGAPAPAPADPAALASGGVGSPEPAAAGTGAAVGVDSVGGDPPIILNWESTEARWVLPSELPLLPHVPLLLETLRRLVLPRYMAAHVTHLADDRVHGAAELAEYTVQAFGAVAAYELKGSDEQHAQLDAQQPCWQAVCEAYHNFAWHLALSRPSMAAVANAAAGVMAAMDVELRARADPFGPDAAAIRVALLEAVASEAERLRARGTALRARAAALLPAGARVLTTSYSSTVLGALSEAAGRLGGVVVCESRPLCEGVAMARALAAAGVPQVTVITDAQAGVFVRQADAVLLGADALTPRGTVNKVGSWLIALAAREAGVPVYACCDSGKVSPDEPLRSLVGLAGGCQDVGAQGGSDKEAHEEKAASEVEAVWPQQLRPAEAAGGGGGVAVRNVYFETVPLDLLTGGAVTEDGLQSTEDICAAVEAQRQRYLDAFALFTLHHPPR